MDMVSRLERCSLIRCAQRNPVLVVDYLLHQTMRLLVSHQGFHTILLTLDPPHDCSSHKEAWLIRQVDGQGTRLPDTQRYIAGEMPAIYRRIPDNTLALRQIRIGRSQGNRQGSDGRDKSRRA
jgi:hypothetical protein